MTLVSELRLCDIASSDVSTVLPDASLAVAVEQFIERRISSLVVLEGGKPIGIVTEFDLLLLLCRGSAGGRTVRSVMSSPLVTTSREMDFSGAQLLMMMRAIRHLVLVDHEGNLEGVASETDFRRHLGVDVFEQIPSLQAVIDQGSQLIPPEQSLAVSLQTMCDQRLDHLVVGRDGRPEGIFTERDVPRLLARNVDPEKLTMGEVMAWPIRFVGVGAPVAEVARQMAQFALRHMVVLNTDGRMAGVVSQHRILERLGMVLMDESRSRLESRLGVVLEVTNVGVWEYDHRREVLIRSQALNRLVKLPERLNFEKLEDVLRRAGPEDRERVASAFKAVLSGASDRLNIQYRVRDAQGQSCWISCRGRVIEWDTAGAPLRTVGVAMDVSEQKGVETSLRQSESRFRGLLEDIPLALCYVNAEEKLVFINERFKNAFGYSLEDVPNLDAWWQRAYPDETYRTWVLETWTDALRDAAANRYPIQTIELAITCKDGSVRYFEASGAVLGDELLATYVDVTDRRQQQALLVFSNAVLQHISIGAPLRDVLDFIAREIEGLQPGIHCAIQLLDETGQHLLHGAAPSLPKGYVAAIDGVCVGEGVGSCGTAVVRRERVFSGDIASDPLWKDFLELAEEYGLAACWSSPIFSNVGEVLGTFAIYWQSPQTEVGAIIRRFVETATSLANVAVESSQRESELRSTHDGLLRAEAIGGLGSWTWDRASGHVRWSRQMYSLFGLDLNGTAPSLDEMLDLVHPEDRDIMLEIVGKMQAGELPTKKFYRRHPSLGELRYLESNFVALSDASGKLTGFEGTLLDVTATRQSEERLRNQLDELRRWQQVTLGREGRVLELKREVNALLERLGEKPRYGSVIDGGVAP